MKQIIAMGGGGFGPEKTMAKVQEYILSASGKEHPRVCLLPTAGADKHEAILEFYDAILALGGTPSHLSLFRLPTADLEGFLLDKDILFVGGGNTRSMMALWREWDLFRILGKAYQNGILCAGVSAGGNCWFEQGVSNSVPGQMLALDCTGIVPGSFCPHYDSQPERRPGYHALVTSGTAAAGYGADEAAALHLREGEEPLALRFGANANVYHVEATGGAVLETPLANVVDLVV
jgi:peptidase E